MRPDGKKERRVVPTQSFVMMHLHASSTRVPVATGQWYEAKKFYPCDSGWYVFQHISNPSERQMMYWDSSEWLALMGQPRIIKLKGWFFCGMAAPYDFQQATRFH